MNKFLTDVRNNIRPKAEKEAYYPYGFSPEFQVTYTPMRSGVFNIYLFGAIEDASQFVYAIECLQAATENDVVILHLSSPGGSLDATDTFIMALQDCEAKIIMKASGGVHSAGTVILMQADEFYLSENFNALIHNGSCGSGGKFNEFVSQSRHVQGYMETVMRRTYEGFLSEEEIDALLEGKDFWMDGDEFASRFQARWEYLGAKRESAVAEALAALVPEVEPVVEPKPKRTRKAQ